MSKKKPAFPLLEKEGWREAPGWSVRPRLVHLWIVFGILSAVTLVAYWNSFTVPLVFDDLVTIQRNTSVRFGEFARGQFLGARSMLYLTFVLNYIWAGQQVWTYHLVNFLLHLFNGVLIFLLAVRIFRHVESNEVLARWYALAAALFFLVHPVQTESVTYISSRSELLSAFFYLIGFLVFVWWPQPRIGFLCFIAVAIPYSFALGSKEPAITLPVAIFLYDFLFLSGSQFRSVMAARCRFYLPFLIGAAGATYYLLHVVLRLTVGTGRAGSLSNWTYLLTELRVIVRYIRLVFLPTGLNLDYDFTPSSSVFEPAVLGSLLFLSAIVVLGWMLRRSYPVFAFSILFFFIALSPTSSVIPIIDVIFEHRLYLPMIGACLSFPFLIEFVHRKLRERVRLPGTAFTYASLIVVALIVGTIQRNYIWGDEMRLWSDSVSKSPHKERPHSSLAFAYYKRGDYERAIEVLEKARGLVIDNASNLSDSLGNFYLKAGRYDESIKLFTEETQVQKADLLVHAYNNLGVSWLYKWNELQSRRAQLSEQDFILQREQILEPAARAFQKVLELDRDMDWALDSYINVSCYRGKGHEIEATALDHLKEKEDFNDLYTVGKVAFNSGDYATADRYFERGEQLRKDVRIVFFNHGYALRKLKQDDRAIDKYLQAIRIDPIFSEAHHNLGQIYLDQHEYGKAAEAFEEVLRFDPKHVSSNLYLAYIRMSQGNKKAARSHLLTVLQVSPGNPQATQMLEQLGS